MLEKKQKMKLIQFVGARNKSDLVMYIAHVLTNLNKRVLVVDGTRNELYKNGFINTEKSQFLFDFQGIDILAGSNNWLDIEECLQRSGETTIAYDAILVDHDYVETFSQEWPTFTDRFYVGDFDRANQLLDSEMINTLIETTENNEFKRITFESNYKMDTSYFESFLAKNVKWRSINYLFQPDDLLEGLRMQMQHEQVIPYKRLSKQYKELVTEIVSALYEIHIKDITDAVKPSFFKLPFKRTKNVELESSNA